MDQIEKRVWGYCRCGGADQTDIENQVEQLRLGKLMLFLLKRQLNIH